MDYFLMDLNKYNIPIFKHDTSQKYSGDIELLFKNTRCLAFHFLSTRKRSQPSQCDFFAWITK